MNYIAEVDDSACAAHGDCVDVAPEVFELDDVATVIGTGPDELLLAAARGLPELGDQDYRPAHQRAGLPLTAGGGPSP